MFPVPAETYIRTLIPMCMSQTRKITCIKIKGKIMLISSTPKESLDLKVQSLRRCTASLEWCPMMGFGFRTGDPLHSVTVRHHLPTNFIPAASSWGTYFGFTSYRCLCLSSILSLLPYNCSEIQNNQVLSTLNVGSPFLRWLNYGNKIRSPNKVNKCIKNLD
jgi:hypothetical protein